MSGGTAAELPRWADLVLLPLVNLFLALLVTAGVILAVGQPPLEALRALVLGSLGSFDALGYTLYYTTDMVFAGLAVALAFQCGLFNIGGEGQAYIAGLGVSLAALNLEFLPTPLLVPVAILAGTAFGGAWGAVPGWLQA